MAISPLYSLSAEEPLWIRHLQQDQPKSGGAKAVYPRYYIATTLLEIQIPTGKLFYHPNGSIVFYHAHMAQYHEVACKTTEV